MFIYFGGIIWRCLDSIIFNINRVNKCASKYCRKDKAKGRSKCYSCLSREYRRNNPEKSAYQNLKQNAKRRGKVFKLTFEQFQEFAIKTEYMARKGIFKDSLHIDRIDPEKGYTADNIRTLTNSENVSRHRKYLRWLTDERGRPETFFVETKNLNNNPVDYENLPF